MSLYQTMGIETFGVFSSHGQGEEDACAAGPQHHVAGQFFAKVESKRKLLKLLVVILAVVVVVAAAAVIVVYVFVFMLICV